MEYRLLRAGNERDLVDMVTNSIDAGWAPLGGVAIAVSTSLGGTWFYQALTRSKKAESAPTDA